MPTDNDAPDGLESRIPGPDAARSVFTGKVADYVASRPDYPAALFAMLQAECPSGANVTVADVGSGTGLLTHGLLRSGYRVVAVEPNQEMRAAADSVLGGASGYRSVEGSAESMPLEAESIHLVTAAQAFHWFEIERARAEFLRILTPRGKVALIWNDRILDDPLHVALDEVFESFGGARRGALLAHEDRSNIPLFFGSAQLKEFSWPHANYLDEEALLSLVFSRSYMPNRVTTDGRLVGDSVRKVFDRFVSSGRVEVRYRTVATLGRPAPKRHAQPDSRSKHDCAE